MSVAELFREVSDLLTLAKKAADLEVFVARLTAENRRLADDRDEKPLLSKGAHPHVYRRIALRSLQKDVHDNAVSNGFHPKDAFGNRKPPRTIDRINSALMLIVSEAGETCEELRDPASVMAGQDGAKSADLEHIRMLRYEPSGKPIGFASELADIVIRCFDVAGLLDLDLALAITEKMAYNATRPAKHGGKTI